MTIEELIKELERYNKDTEVLIRIDDHQALVRNVDFEEYVDEFIIVIS